MHQNNIEFLEINICGTQSMLPVFFSLFSLLTVHPLPFYSSICHFYWIIFCPQSSVMAADKNEDIYWIIFCPQSSLMAADKNEDIYWIICCPQSSLMAADKKMAVDKKTI